MGSPDIAGHFYDRVVNLLTKDPEDRHEQEIDQILSWFRKKSELFKTLKREIVADLIKNCEFETSEKDDVIIEQGDKGDCFFIILGGSVAIHINTNYGNDDDNFNEKKSEVRSKDDNSSIASERQPLDRSMYGNYVGKIEAGKSFGELALINADCVRNATIIANELTDLIVVNRELYNRCLKAFQAKEFEERKKFVECHELFSKWQLKYKKQMAMSLRKEKMYFDSVIVRQGAPVDGLIFLLSGQVKILTDPTLHQLQYSNYFPLADPEDLEKEEARESLRRELSILSSRFENKKPEKRLPTPHSNLTSPHSSIISPHISTPTQDGKSRNKTPHKTVVEVCNLGAQEIIGDLEAVLDLPTYSQTILCNQEAEFYVLDQKNYDRLIEKRNPRVIDMLKKSVCQKYSLRLSWVQDNQIPLLRYFLYKLEEEVKSQSQRSTPVKSQVRQHSNDLCVSKLAKGPLIDMFGPGSVFYMIRMKEKQRHRERDRYQNDQRKIQARSQMTPRSTTQAPLMTYSNQGAFVTQGHLNVQEAEESEGEPMNNSDEIDIGAEHERTQSKLICVHSKETMATCFSNDDSSDDIEDKEVNDSALQILENKIEAWHRSIGEDPYRRYAKRTVKLHRMSHENVAPPLPGKTVYIRPKHRRKVDIIANLKSSVKEEEEEVPSMFSKQTNEYNSNARSTKQQGPGSFSGRIKSQKFNPHRPVSARSWLMPTYLPKRRRPTSARQYTAEDYEALKEELRRKQRAFKSLLYRPA